MISEKVQTLLFEAIQIFDALTEKDYLLFGQRGLRHSIEVFPIRIRKEHFWHLLGCKATKKIDDLYGRCKKRENIKDFVDYANGSTEKLCFDKYSTFRKVFDFVNKAKEIKICDTTDTPDKFNFVLAVGHYNGIIGYDNNPFSCFFFPKSTQSKPIKEFNSNNQARKVVAIVEKPYFCPYFNKVSYEIKQNILKEIVQKVDEDYQKMLDKNLIK